MAITAITSPSILYIILGHLLFLAGLQQIPIHAAAGGQWELLHKSIGVIAMHMQLLHNDRIIIYDLTDFGPSNISLPGKDCRRRDCSAHSVEYDVLTNSVRPLTLHTDSWCSSGSVGYNGQLVQTGGFSSGERVIRKFWPCDECDWEEVDKALFVRRWYATNVKLPDGGALIVGGRHQFNYEFYPKSAMKKTDSLVWFPFLQETKDEEENNLYPFVHLNVDGNLFIYANNRSILLDYRNNVIVRKFPSIPGGDPRNYPSTGSSVLLPLKNPLHTSVEAEVLICGGTPRWSYTQAEEERKRFIPALNTCGRLKITDASPVWKMETMPLRRTMGDMILLPNSKVLIINGAGAGSAGWEDGRKPVVHPVIYKPNNHFASRFEVQSPSSIPRLYHSSAVLVRDGRVLVGGSNPHINYNYTGVLYPTELSLEAFSPPYLDSEFSSLRPTIISPNATAKIQLGYMQKLSVSFSVSSGVLRDQDIAVTMVAPPFTTHSFAMSQRLLVLNRSRLLVGFAESTYEMTVSMPKSGFVAPPGYYMLFVVHNDVPSEGIWVQVGKVWKNRE